MQVILVIAKHGAGLGHCARGGLDGLPRSETSGAHMIATHAFDLPER
jgi:hypothetical protein